MSYLKRRILRIYGNHMMRKYGGLAQQSVDAGGNIRNVNEETSLTARLTAAEGCVLLRNNGSLPLKKDQKIAVFGRCQQDWFYVGYGSGGDVNPPYRINLVEGLQRFGASFDQELLSLYDSWRAKKRNEADDGFWGHWPMNYPEMPISRSLAGQTAGRQRGVSKTTAVVVIGRAAGEDRENTLTRGSFYLTRTEEQMLRNVTAAFQNVIVIMNIGNIMDFSWMEKYGDKISALLIVWQGGMESGNAVCDVLYGAVNPSGRLPDTIARKYTDYPSASDFGGKEYNEYREGIYVGYRHFEKKAQDAVLFPFGYGLSYSEFKLEKIKAEYDSRPELLIDQAIYEHTDAPLKLFVKVTNTGCTAGKEVVQVWCRQPEGKIEKADKILAGFVKTKLLEPGQSEDICIEISLKHLASYAESDSAFLLEKGAYEFYLSENNQPKDFQQPVTILRVMETVVAEQCEKACTAEVDLHSRILDRLPEDIPFQGDRGYKLQDVQSSSSAADHRKISLQQFLEQLTNEELEALTRGHGMMSSPLGVPGNAGVFGGVLPSLREKGIRPIVTADGPAGLRLRTYCALMPCGTLQAATFNTSLVRQLYSCVGQEMQELGVDVLLGPGMNIHRNPLCGRNFEYFSEDPVLSGYMGAAVVQGIQSKGKAASIKHFACNNQETRRNTNDSRVSERALREIYLKNFEICIERSDPKVLMTSYNKLNGVWAHYHYDLVTTILRKQWGYKGVVMTDWWMQSSHSPEFPELRDNAYRVRAQVDVLMPGDSSRMVTDYVSDGTLLESLGKKEGITRGELARSAANVLKLAMYLDANDEKDKR